MKFLLNQLYQYLRLADAGYRLDVLNADVEDYRKNIASGKLLDYARTIPMVRP